MRYDCKQSPIVLLETSTVMVQWSSDVNQPFTFSYVIGEYPITLPDFLSGRLSVFARTKLHAVTSLHVTMH